MPVKLKQDDKWQFDDLALLDFEDATGACGNGTPETNTDVSGTVPAGHSYSGMQFTGGSAVRKNHTDLTTMPSPLNLTAIAWVWNAGRKFLRVELASTGKPRGFVLHLGSTGCTANRGPHHGPHNLRSSQPGGSLACRFRPSQRPGGGGSRRTAEGFRSRR